eukprot:TRINITY_DN24137_c0_g1_i1.p2 TRINITY_DN24137_c0_g1~~TRINITY_DN24137_c0_g1_i1.p2  ORF type:complete len:396 (+),score=34.96 TRINITY_DN24137_c0_g1_i1:54-1241(+)
MSSCNSRKAVVDLTLFALLLVSCVGQRLAFKTVGYELGPYPYFVVLSISFVFVPIFGVICIGITATTGGWSPESRTWRTIGVFLVIGCLNAVQGVTMVFSNPYVPGYLQALLAQAMIPFTLIISRFTRGTEYSCRQYAGVLVIAASIVLQILPGIMVGTSTYSGASLTWSFVYLIGQLPAAAAGVFQESMFAHLKVNVFHMMFWASVAQLFVMILLAPLQIVSLVGQFSSMSDFMSNMEQAWRLCFSGAGVGLGLCVITMFAATVSQVLLVKHSSAAFAVICNAVVVPASAIAFAMPFLMGSHAESLGICAVVAVTFGCFGIVIFRFEHANVEIVDKVMTPVSLPLLVERVSVPESQPLCVTGVGLIQSGYSNARKTSIPIWQECTLMDAPIVSA